MVSLVQQRSDLIDQMNIFEVSFRFVSSATGRLSGHQKEISRKATPLYFRMSNSRMATASETHEFSNRMSKINNSPLMWMLMH